MIKKSNFLLKSSVSLNSSASIPDTVHSLFLSYRSCIEEMHVSSEENNTDNKTSKSAQNHNKSLQRPSR